MKNWIRRNYWKVLLCLIFVISMLILNNYTQQSHLKMDNEFYNAKLKGKIISIDASAGADYFRLSNDLTKYCIYSNFIWANGKQIDFQNTAQIGDSIVKEPMAKSFKLIKGDQVYNFTSNP